MKLIYKSITYEELQELSKEYFIDLAGFGTKNHRGAPRLVKKGTIYYNYGVECKTVVKLHRGLKALIKNNLGILTILNDSVSDKIKQFLRENGNTGLILKDP